MKHIDTIREIANEMGFLDDKGVMMRLDSLAVMDLITALEAATELSVPTASLRQESFQSLESIARLLDTLDTGSSEAASR